MSDLYARVRALEETIAHRRSLISLMSNCSPFEGDDAEREEHGRVIGACYQELEQIALREAELAALRQLADELIEADQNAHTFKAASTVIWQLAMRARELRK